MKSFCCKKAEHYYWPQRQLVSVLRLHYHFELSNCFFHPKDDSSITKELFFN